ncbi:MAG: Tetratricopeptide TPR_2 repeat protein [Candidatus Magnetoglobus multicellularis str. Araruama]|uniref:Tetratricopeptide TPR_2 repeat protein n=1 Tax=Candidatus Magnetoglobus multicellularis str. Araruama TaxID=890399 RepID=A0A1V1P317_9BACT|nr:MAG: Tetratricopeptide TPR_2 repeat protein [Candidatus Magnetoglobus multicellularis str. Araruama]
MSLHAFVAMPYQTKKGINFDKVYRELIYPALDAEGFRVFRADEEKSSGDIRKDMFQELLLADIVIADISIDNPNVWYELGVRHALRATGIIHIKCRRTKIPFDICSDRTLSYSVDTKGEPDINHLENDRKELAEFVKNTQLKMRYEKTSPIYNLLSNLKEPGWRALRTQNFQKYHQELEDNIEYARIHQKAANILVYSEEACNQSLKLEIYRSAANALRDMGQYEFSLEQVEKALEIDPKDIKSLRIKCIVLGRLGEIDKAKIQIKRLIDEYPNDAESRALLGRIEKDAWIASWRNKSKTSDEMIADAADEEDLLKDAINAYKYGFLLDPGHYYSGINALTLTHLLCYLTKINNDTDPKELMGGVRWAIKCAIEKIQKIIGLVSLWQILKS